MNSSDNWLVHDHSLYEELLEECQESVAAEDWHAAEAVFQQLVKHLKQHMALEEEVLYPAYDAKVSHRPAPTEALQEEHDRLVNMVCDIARVMGNRDSGHIVACLERLEQVMIIHHEREEDIFLPMASHILQANRDQLSQQLQQFDASRIRRKWDI